ncbi:putative protein phosphatase 2C 14 [Silene latifolia]|uniref:putative protein phosphatase 2C 14 n=1 Tax=Silene latifolia TaxID=37657 RepID=UPI003D786867
MDSESSTFPKETLKRKRPPKIQIPTVLKQIDISAFSPVKPDAVSSFEDACVGLFSVKGKKKFMEDSHKILSCIHGNPNKGFFGVYDGHGGRKAVEFVEEHLHENIIEMVENCQGSTGKDEAVKAAYLRTDKEFLEQDVGSGACCITVLIDGGEMVVSNLGDCRAVVCRGGVAEALTKDHKPEREDERKRIEDEGGYVEFNKSAWRVHGILSVSRSIGDAHLKEWVVSEPDSRILDLAPDMDFLVLASDGLWELVGCQEAVDIVLQSIQGESKSYPFADLDNKNKRSLEESNDEYACISTNSSPKLKRVSMIKQKQQITPRSSSFRKKRNAKTVRQDTENESPPVKLRRTALFPHKNMKIQSPNQENAKPSSVRLVAACKELVNRAVTKGSMDDITVIIIDLNHFKQAIPRKCLP